MHATAFLRTFLMWVPMIAIAVLNGTLRQVLFLRFLSESAAAPGSTILLLVFFAIYTRMGLPSLAGRDDQRRNGARWAVADSDSRVRIRPGRCGRQDNS